MVAKTIDLPYQTVPEMDTYEMQGIICNDMQQQLVLKNIGCDTGFSIVARYLWIVLHFFAFATPYTSH